MHRPVKNSFSTMPVTAMPQLMAKMTQPTGPLSVTSASNPTMLSSKPSTCKPMLTRSSAGAK
jgi:hypothetical protein